MYQVSAQGVDERIIIIIWSKFQEQNQKKGRASAAKPPKDLGADSPLFLY